MTASDGNPGAESSAAPIEDDVLDPGSDTEGLAGEASDQHTDPEGTEGEPSAELDEPSPDERIGNLFDEDAGFSEATPLSDKPTDEDPDNEGGQDDGEPDPAGADPTADQVVEPTAEEAALAELELTDQDKAEAPRTQKRIKKLLERAKAAEARTSTYAEHIDFVREKAGMTDEDVVTSIYDIARIRSADPEMVPVLEKLAADIRQVRGIAAPVATPAVPTIEPFTGELPAAFKAAVEYGDMTEEQARRYVAVDAAFAKVEQSKQAQPARPEPAATPQPDQAQAQARAEYEQQVRGAIQASNARISTYLAKSGVKDLAAYYRDLEPVILKEAGVAALDDIPIQERFQVVKDAHRALQEQHLRGVQERAGKRDKRQPVRQSGQGAVGARNATNKPKSVAHFYDEDADA
jgi:hypothetical protein